MGYCLAFSECVGCRSIFGYNPNYVPSIRTSYGTKEPVCKQCIERANPIRKEKGLPEFTIHPQAYEPLNEEEL